MGKKRKTVLVITMNLILSLLFIGCSGVNSKLPRAQTVAIAPDNQNVVVVSDDLGEEATGILNSIINSGDLEASNETFDVSKPGKIIGIYYLYGDTYKVSLNGKW